MVLHASHRKTASRSKIYGSIYSSKTITKAKTIYSCHLQIDSGTIPVFLAKLPHCAANHRCSDVWIRIFPQFWRTECPCRSRVHPRSRWWGFQTVKTRVGLANLQDQSEKTSTILAGLEFTFVRKLSWVRVGFQRRIFSGFLRTFCIWWSGGQTEHAMYIK